MRTKLLVAAVVAAVVAGGAGVAYATSTAITSSTTDVVVSRGGTYVSLDPGSDIRTTVASVTLPAGAWVLSADAVLFNSAPDVDHFYCAITRGSTDVAFTQLAIGTVASPGSNVQTAGSGTVAMQGAVRLTTKTLITLACGHGTATQYADGQAAYVSLVAHKSTSLVQITQ